MMSDVKQYNLHLAHESGLVREEIPIVGDERGRVFVWHPGKFGQFSLRSSQSLF